MEVNGHRRGRRRDHVAHYNGEVSISVTDDELDPWTAWAYKPRTISLLFIGACFLIWASGALDPEGSSSADLVTSVKRGIWAMIAVFLTYCLLQAPSTITFPVTKELPSQIEQYRRLRSVGGNFSTKEAAANYAQMMALKEAQADVSDPMSDTAIVEAVLHTRRGWKRGIGQQLPRSDASSSCTSQSTQRLFTQEEVSQMMAEDADLDEVIY